MTEQTQKVALVTGATRGIGKAVAEGLAKDGHIVVGTATSDTGATAISENFSQQGVTGRGAVLDVTRPADIDGLIKSVTEEFGTPGVLVNNAGITRDNILMRMKEDEWDDIMDTNLKSVFRLSKAVIRGMSKARYGRIINITSVVGSAGNAGQSNYAAAKAGIIGFTKSLALEVASRGVTVNAVAPGFIDTDMTRALNEKQVEGLTANIPVGRLGQPEDIAHAVAFLASPGAAYINGVTLHVNGGLYMT